MSDPNSTFVSDMEELMRKTAEANKTFIREGSRFIRQLGSSPKSIKEIPAIQPELLKEAFGTIMKLNIRHATQLIDLGLELSRKFNTAETTTSSFEEKTNTKSESGQPAFVMNTEASPGSIAKLPFIVDSDKSEPMDCQLVHTDFIHQNDFAIKPKFEISFTPSSFQLSPLESQTVEMHILIPSETVPGIYVSHLQVKGFELAFFSVHLNVSHPDQTR